jgi:hypothetical protein
LSFSIESAPRLSFTSDKDSIDSITFLLFLSASSSPSKILPESEKILSVRSLDFLIKALISILFFSISSLFSFMVSLEVLKQPDFFERLFEINEKINFIENQFTRILKREKL